MLAFLQKIFRKPVLRPGLGIALYGPSCKALDLLKGLEGVQKWAVNLGLPEGEWVTLNYGVPGDRHYKTYKLSAWVKRGCPFPDSTCTSIETGRFSPGSKRGMTDEVWYACLSADRPELTLDFDLNIVSPTNADLVALVADIQSIANFEYGYMFRMSMEKSLSTYVAGLPFGNPATGLTRAQEDAINKWGNARGACSSWLDDEITHYLRDVYPLNFLNPHHLSMQVKGQSLKDWIEFDPKRGILKPLIESKLWTWAVPDNRIQSIRKVLGPERLLISWGDFNTPSGGPLGHTYGTKKGEKPAFKGKPLTKDGERWIVEGLALMKPLFNCYTGESPEHFDQLIVRREPLFAKLLDMAFTAWSEDARPDRLTTDKALHAFAAALGEHLVKRYRMAWYAVEDEYGRSLGVCRRGKGGAQTWSYPVDAVAKRIDRGETGFITGIMEAVGNEIERG